MTYRWDRRPWSNWLGDVVIKHPERHCYPATRDELLEIVTDAEWQTPQRKIRASGSHWALSDIAAADTPDWFVETSALSDTITDVIPQALSPEARDELARNAHGTGHGFTYYHVQAGITISELSQRLDADSRERWALPTMGGSAGQTLAGAISTGVHGGDHQMPPIADFVHAIHLLTSGGRQLWIERHSGITDADMLAQALLNVRQERSTSLFNAVLVAAGRMGIIYSLVIKVVEQFSLDQITIKSTWEEQQKYLRAPFPIFSQPPPGQAELQQPEAIPNRFVEVLMSPYADDEGRHICYVTLRWTGPDGPRLPPPRGLFTVLCRYRTLQPVVLALLGGDLALLLLTVLAAGKARLLIKAEAATLAALALLLPASGHASIGDLLAAACNTADRYGQARLVRWLVAQVLRQVRPLKRTQDVGYHIMDLGRSGANCYRGDAVEVAFDATAGDHVSFVNEDLFPTFDRMAEQGNTVAGYVSLRFTRKSAGLLAMQRWDPTGMIEIAILKGIKGGTQILETLQSAAVCRGGTVHWGERNTLTPSGRATRVPGAWPVAGRAGADGRNTRRDVRQYFLPGAWPGATMTKPVAHDLRRHTRLSQIARDYGPRS